MDFPFTADFLPIETFLRFQESKSLILWNSYSPNKAQIHSKALVFEPWT